MSFGQRHEFHQGRTDDRGREGDHRLGGASTEEADKPYSVEARECRRMIKEACKHIPNIEGGFGWAHASTPGTDVCTANEVVK